MSIEVRVTVIHITPELIGSAECPSCGRPMQLHQPEIGMPERMLWTCGLCGDWFLMDVCPGGHEAVLVSLPDGGYFTGPVGRSCLGESSDHAVEL